MYLSTQHIIHRLTIYSRIFQYLLRNIQNLICKLCRYNTKLLKTTFMYFEFNNLGTKFFEMSGESFFSYLLIIFKYHVKYNFRKYLTIFQNFSERKFIKFNETKFVSFIVDLLMYCVMEVGSTYFSTSRSYKLILFILYLQKKYLC